MLDKIKKYQKHPYVQELRDVRVLGLMVFCIIVLLVSWSGVRVIETNYTLQRQIARMEQQTKLVELENSNKELENSYLRSDRYLELQARRQFGKAAPGETVLLVPESIALKYTFDTKTNDSNKKIKTSDKPFYQKNFESWMDFFFRKSTTL